MPSSVELFKKYPNQHFVETGTWHGDGVWCARRAGFDSVRSIELSPSLYKQCVERFKGDNRVKLYNGDSGEILGSVIADINEPITFWLDGHYSEGDTVKGPCMSPVLQELEAIAKHHVKNHTILIDDRHDFFTEMFGGVTEDQAKKIISAIDPDYQFEVVDDVLVAKITRKCDELTRLADHYGSDKGRYGYYDLPLGHRFTEIYYQLFKDKKYEFKKILEVGIDGGASVRMWRDFFPNAQVWGADIYLKFKDEDRIKVIRVDQGLESDRKMLVEKIGYDVDLIVEDGSHTNIHQQRTFASLFRMLKEDGTYILEDVHCGRLASRGPSPSTLSVFQQYLRDGIINTPHISREKALYLKRTIKSCVPYNIPGTGVPGGSEMIVFTKKQPKIVIVGNGPSLVGSSLGKKIDEFDTVVRINNFRTDGFEEDVGKKTSVWWRNDCNDIDEPKRSFENIMLSILPTTDKERADKLKEKYEDIHVVVPEHVHNHVRSCMKCKDQSWPSTGLIAITYFAQMYGKISICGFDGFTGKKHYWEPDTPPHTDFHEVEKEQAYVRELVEQGLVEIL